jgi:MFS family permease
MNKTITQASVFNTHDLLRELRFFYWSMTIFSLGISLLQIFIPLYLYKQQVSVPWIIAFFAILNGCRFIAALFAGMISSQAGAKRTMLIGFALQAISYILLLTVSTVNVLFFCTSALLGIAYAFLWIPYHIHFSKISSLPERGQIIGKMNIYISLATALGPLLGGVLVIYFGFNIAFVLAAILLLVAGGLLLKTPEISVIRKLNLKLEMFRRIFLDTIANGFYNFQFFLIAVVWPLYIFIFVPDYFSIGSIQTVSLFIGSVSFYIAGLWTDRMSYKKVLLLSSVVNSLISGLRVFANNLLSIVVFNIATTSTGSIQSVPWTAKFYEHLSKELRIEYCVQFEMGGAIVSALGMGLLASIFMMGGFSILNMLVIAIIFSAVAGLLINLIRS